MARGWMDGWIEIGYERERRLDDGWMTRGVDAWWRREVEDAWREVTDGEM